MIGRARNFIFCYSNLFRISDLEFGLWISIRIIVLYLEIYISMVRYWVLC